MNIRVEYDDLEEITKTTDENKANLKKEIDILLNSLERIKNSWVGDDSDAFYSKAHDYIERMNVLCGFMETANELIKCENHLCQYQDNSYSQQLNRERLENEDDIN